MKLYMSLVLLLFSTTSIAGGWSHWASPTQVDVERGNGIMVYGAFGNPSECGLSDRFYIPKTHPEYDKIYAVVLTAFTAQKELRVYSHNCGKVGWYTANATAFNFVGDGAVYIRH